MDRLGAEVDKLHKIKTPDHKVQEYIEFLLPMPENETNLQEKNIQQLRDDLQVSYFEAQI